MGNQSFLLGLKKRISIIILFYFYILRIQFQCNVGQQTKSLSKLLSSLHLFLHYKGVFSYYIVQLNYISNGIPRVLKFQFNFIDVTQGEIHPVSYSLFINIQTHILICKYVDER